jgi:hypothetical protein
LTTDPQGALIEMFKFLLQKEDLEGLAINETIKTVVAEQIKEQSSLEVYKPRSGKINNNTARYSLE